MRPRLVATDLDGTLLRPDGTISVRTGRVLRALHAQGIDVVFVTARPPRWIDDVAHAVAGHGIVICLNGAFVYEPGSRRVLEHRTIADELLVDVVADLRAALPGAAFAVEGVSGIGSEHGFDHGEHVLPPDASVAERVEELLDGTAGKLLVRCAGTPTTVLVDQVERVLAGRAVVADSGAAGLAEISGPGVSKGATLARWAAARGIAARDVWAFGDMPNDLPMLRWAGRAFAVANAHPEVIAVADEVCGSNAEDGVATRLENVGPDDGPRARLGCDE
jgi:hypothetical protein